MAEHRILAPNRSYLVEVIDDETLLYDPSRTKSLYLNGCASLVWQLCDGSRDVAEIKRLLLEAYPDADAVIDEDVESALRQLVEHGALTVR